MKKIFSFIKTIVDIFVKKISGFFHFNKKELIILVSIGAFVILLSIIIPVALITTNKKETVNAQQYVNSIDINNKQPELSDFYLDDQLVNEALTGIIFSRDPEQEWSKEEIDKYWIDPRKIAIEHLERESEILVEDIFKDVP